MRPWQQMNIEGLIRSIWNDEDIEDADTVLDLIITGLGDIMELENDGFDRCRFEEACKKENSLS